MSKNCPIFKTVIAASGWSIDREAGEIRELPQAELWSKDLRLHPAIHSGDSDLPHPW